MINFGNSWGQNKETNNPKFATIGENIQFKRKGVVCYGTVIKQRENTVMIELDKESSDFLGYENNLTVVNHKNYRVILHNNAASF